MKDKVLEGKIAELEHALQYERKVRLDLEIYVHEHRADLEYRVKELERRVEKDCPVCGHKTLMVWKHGLMKYDTEASNDGMLVARYVMVRPDGWYCYGCGKTFKEAEGLVEA